MIINRKYIVMQHVITQLKYCLSSLSIHSNASLLILLILLPTFSLPSNYVVKHQPRQLLVDFGSEKGAQF
jgi:hypothetical protein